LSPRNKWLNAIINELAPDVLELALKDWLCDKTPGEAYEFFTQNKDKDWYELLPLKTRRAVEKLAPNDLSWFNTQWAIQAIGRANPKIASLILGSDSLQAILSEKIELLKRNVLKGGREIEA